MAQGLSHQRAVNVTLGNEYDEFAPSRIANRESRIPAETDLGAATNDIEMTAELPSARMVMAVPARGAGSYGRLHTTAALFSQFAERGRISRPNSHTMPASQGAVPNVGPSRNPKSPKSSLKAHLTGVFSGRLARCLEGFGHVVRQRHSCPSQQKLKRQTRLD